MKAAFPATLIVLLLTFAVLVPAIAQEGATEWEPNDRRRDADVISGFRIEGEIGRRGDDDDWFVLQGQEGSNATFTIWYDDDTCDIDFEVYSNRNLVDSADGVASPDSVTCRIPGECFIHVFVYDGYGEYTIEIDPRESVGEGVDGGNLHGLLSSDTVDVEVSGVDIQSVNFRLRRTVNRDVRITIPAGTYLRAGAGNTQNMVTTSGETISLTNSGWRTVTVPAACATLDGDEPHSRDSFTIVTSVDRELTDIIAVLDESWESFEVIQAAIWIVADDARYRDLDMLVDEDNERVIGPDEAGRAMQLVDEAGIDITRKHIWGDRTFILTRLDDWAVEQWLRQRIEDWR